jgi:hypothetical protein
MVSNFPHLRKLANSSGSWELPTALAGAGLAGLAYGMGGDDHYDLIRKTLAEDQSPMQPWETSLSRYTKAMSPGAKTSILGMPVGEIITKMRANPDVMNAMGLSKDVLINNPSQKQEGLAHYEQFGRGPLSAYWHQLLKLGENVPASPELTGGKEMTYKELMLPRLEAFWKQRMHEGGAGAADKGALKWLLPYEIDTDYMGHQEQLDIMREFAESLPPELQRERQRVETDVMGEPLRKHQQNYMPTYNSVTNAREILKTLGLTAGGAGVGGLAGNYLYRGLTDDEKENDDSRRLAALAGAGVGGGAGFLASHHGRGLLNKLFTKGAQERTMRTPTILTMNPDQFPFLKAAAEKKAMLQLGTRALAAGSKAAPAVGRTLAKMKGGFSLGDKALGGAGAALAATGLGLGAYNLNQLGQMSESMPPAAPKASPNPVAQAPQPAPPMPKGLSDWIGAGPTAPVMPSPPQSTLAAAPKPAGPPPVLGSDTPAGAGMTMTGPGSGFAAGVPVMDQGPQTSLPPQPTPAAPEFDFESAFRKYHGTAYDPVSSMDQGKMQQMRDRFQQHGKLSPSLVYGAQYGKQAAARLKVTHPRLGALLEKQAFGLALRGGQAVARGGGALAKVVPTRIFPRAIPKPPGGKIVGLSPLGKGTLAAGGIGAGAYGLSQLGGGDDAGGATPVARMQADRAAQAPQHAQATAAGIAAGQAARQGGAVQDAMWRQGDKVTAQDAMWRQGDKATATPATGPQMPKELSDWIGQGSAGNAAPVLPDRPGTHQRALEAGPKPSAPPGVLGSDIMAGQGMTMTGPGAGFAAGVPVMDQGPQTALPPQPSPVATDYDFDSAFRKFHGTAYDPNSSMDQGKMQQMRDRFQQHGKLSPSLVYGAQYGKQAAARLKVTHPRLGALLEKSARADSDAYISPGRAGLAGAIAPSLAGTYAGTKVEDTPHGIVHGLGTGAGTLAGGLGGGILAALLSNPGKPGVMDSLRGSPDYRKKVNFQQMATLGGAGLGSMAGGGIASALMAGHSNKQRGAVKPKKDPVGGKKDKPKDDSEKDEKPEKAASLSSPQGMAHYALLAADLSTFEKSAIDGQLLGALLGGGAGALYHNTIGGNANNAVLGGKLGKGVAEIANALTLRPAPFTTFGGHGADVTRDFERSMAYPVKGMAAGAGLPGGLASTGIGAMAGGAIGGLLDKDNDKPKKKKPKEEDETDQEESLSSPSKMAHYALLAADLNTLEKAADGGTGALLGALLGAGGGALASKTDWGKGLGGDIGQAAGGAIAPAVRALTPRPNLFTDQWGYGKDLVKDLFTKSHLESKGRDLGQSTGGLATLGAGAGAAIGGAAGSLLGGKKKPKEEDETDQEEESLSRPAKMAHYALLAAELDLTQKQATAASGGYSGHALQSYLPVGEKRQLSPEEEARIEARKGAILPKIFKSLKDNPEADIHSPWTMATLLGVLGAGGGGLLGAGLGGAIGNKADNPDIGAGIGGALGAGLGGLAGGAIGYHGTNASNENVEEMMSRLPEGAKRRDMESDPVYQAQQERKNRLMAAQLMAMR